MRAPASSNAYPLTAIPEFTGRSSRIEAAVSRADKTRREAETSIPFSSQRLRLLFRATAGIIRDTMLK